MSSIFDFIARYMSFLWTDGRFWVVGSPPGTAFQSNAVLVVESTNLRLRFTCDRSQLFLELQPTATELPREWYSIDLVRRLFSGDREFSSILDSTFAEFLRDNLGWVEIRFDSTNWPATRVEMRKLATRRSKELFG